MARIGWKPIARSCVNMAYDLSFSPEFFLAEGEPYDRPDLALNAKGKPVSVYSALAKMPARKWAKMAREVFECHPDYLDREGAPIPMR